MKMERITIPGRAPPEPIYDTEVVTLRLEDAGAALLALPSRGCLPAGYRVNWPTVIADAADACGYGEARVKPAVPTARRIAQMDEAFAWVGLIDERQISHRRIVLLRALTSPVTGRHRHTWRGIGEMFGWDYRAVQRWHAQGIGWIVQALYKQQLDGAAWSRQWKAEREGPESLAPARGEPVHRELGMGMRTTRWG